MSASCGDPDGGARNRRLINKEIRKEVYPSGGGIRKVSWKSSLALERKIGTSNVDLRSIELPEEREQTFCIHAWLAWSKGFEETKPLQNQKSGKRRGKGEICGPFQRILWTKRGTARRKIPTIHKPPTCIGRQRCTRVGKRKSEINQKLRGKSRKGRPTGPTPPRKSLLLTSAN